MNLYVAGAALGATTSAAVLAVWVLGPGGNFTGGKGKEHHAAGRPLDVQVAPFIARIDYQGGSSALVPISIAFRIRDASKAKAFCAELPRIQREVDAMMKSQVGAQFSWNTIAGSGLDKALTRYVNWVVGKDLVETAFLAAGDKGVGDWPTTCARVAMLP